MNVMLLYQMKQMLVLNLRGVTHHNSRLVPSFVQVNVVGMNMTIRPGIVVAGLIVSMAN